MPSLRRTVSESASSTRMSPYPSSLSLSAASALAAGAPIRPRRTASETSGRRVLADIEWWRILDGQQEEFDTNWNENGNGNALGTAVELQPGGLNEAMQDPSENATATLRSEAALMDPVADDTANAVLGGPDASQGASSLTTPFAALSISPVAPMTPPMTPPRTLNNAPHSAASTPDSSPRTPARQYETLFVDSPFNCKGAEDDYDLEFYAPLPPFLTVRGPKGLHSLAMMRSVSFGGFDVSRESDDERFGDVFFI